MFFMCIERYVFATLHADNATIINIPIENKKIYLEGLESIMELPPRSATLSCPESEVIRKKCKLYCNILYTIPATAVEIMHT
jgi:hypothetical protein